MRPEEARELGATISSLGLAAGTICLNVGSSTKRFREIDKPHIQADFIGPLEAQGLRFVHCDIKQADGVDLVGDVFDPDFRRRMKDVGAHLILCCNLLEHLSDPHAFAAACASIVPPGGLVAITVPYDYPCHQDPIDNMLRPSPEEIGRMFPGWILRAGKIIDSGNFLSDTMRKENGLAILLSHLGAVLLPFLSSGRWYPRAHRLLWLWRTYRISIAILERPPEPADQSA